MARSAKPVPLTWREREALVIALREYVEDFNGQYNPDSSDGLDSEDRQHLAALRRILAKL